MINRTQNLTAISFSSKQSSFRTQNCGLNKLRITLRKEGMQWGVYIDQRNRIEEETRLNFNCEIMGE